MDYNEEDFSLHDSNNNLIIRDNDKANNTAVTFNDLPLEVNQNKRIF